jgi:hypothetical protein
MTFDTQCPTRSVEGTAASLLRSTGEGSLRGPSALPRHSRHMKLTNDSYVILIGTKNFTERYYRDKTGWLKISARGRKFRMTAEQVLNHVLPALAGIKPNLTIKVEHQDPLFQNKRSA